MNLAFTTGQVADFVDTDEWRIRRLFEDGTLAEPERFGGKRAISPTLTLAIVDALRARGWLPVESTRANPARSKSRRASGSSAVANSRPLPGQPDLVPGTSGSQQPAAIEPLGVGSPDACIPRSVT